MPLTEWARSCDTHVGFYGWVNHINSVYFNQESIPKWTLQEDDSTPPKLPNAWRDPFGVVDFKVPPEPSADTQRGPASKAAQTLDSRWRFAVSFRMG